MFSKRYNKDIHSKQPHFELLEQRRMLATLTVTNNLDLVNGNALGGITALMNDTGGDGISLREAVIATNRTNGADDIRFSLPLGFETIFLSDGDLEITDLGLTIDGTNLVTGNRVTINGFDNDLSPGFRIQGEDDLGAGEFEIRDLEITGFGVSPLIVGNLSSGDDITFINNIIHANVGTGISIRDVVSGSGEVTIQDNAIYNNIAGISYGLVGPDSPPTNAGSGEITNNRIGYTLSGADAPNAVGGISFGKGAANIFMGGANDIYTANGSGYSYTSDVGAGNTFSVPLASSVNRIGVRADFNGVPGAGLPIDRDANNVIDNVNRPVITSESFIPASSGPVIFVNFSVVADQAGAYVARVHRLDPITFAWQQVGSGGVTLAQGINEDVEFATLGAISEGDIVAVSLIRSSDKINFEFSAAALVPVIMTADFDDDGDVDGNDFLAWQRGFGMTGGATRADGDANGDGNVDGDDLQLWADQFGINAPILADFDGSGDFGLNDLTLWGQSYGIDTGGDADGDGDTDTLDFFAWQVGFARQNNDTDWIEESLEILQLVEDGSVLVVSTATDEVDGDYSLGNLSLREAVMLGNAAMAPTTVVLPSGRYTLSRMGTELGDASYNDLDITGELAIVGQGAGFTVIDSSGLANMSNQLYNRAFHVEGTGTRLAIDGVTLTGGDSSANLSGTAVLVSDYAVFELTDSAVVNNNGTGNGVAIRSSASDVTIRRSVFTNNVSTQNDAALYATKKSYYAGSVTIGQSIFALNQANNGSVTANVWVQNGITKINEGYNLYDDASGNFFNQVPGTGDHLGTTGYVVTTIEDTFDHTNDTESLSLREAIDLSNANAGADEVWLPAWHFELTRDRGTSVYDTDISYGDLDITDDLTIRGVSGANGTATSVAWKSGIVDDVFDLLGDFDNDGQATQGVTGSDFLAWQQQNGSGSQDSSNWGAYSADADDDGDVDGDDYNLWSQYYGNTLDLFDIAV